VCFHFFYECAKSVFGDISHRHQPDETVILVTHGMIGRMIYGVHNNLSWEEAVKTVHLENAGVDELHLQQPRTPPTT
jgi:broad specificity phosphatase PhoE